MREISIVVEDINDKRILTNRKTVSKTLLEVANYPGEILLALYQEATAEIEDRIEAELEENRAIASERRLEGNGT